MRVLLVAVVAVSAFGCVKSRNLSVEEIPKVTKLDDLMDAQSTIADPQFKKIGQATFTDGDFAAFADVGARIGATSAKIKDFTKGPEFDALAAQLHDKAGALASAAAAKDSAAAGKALGEMKDTCKSCHKKFK